MLLYTIIVREPDSLEDCRFVVSGDANSIWELWWYVKTLSDFDKKYREVTIVDNHGHFIDPFGGVAMKHANTLHPGFDGHIIKHN